MRYVVEYFDVLDGTWNVSCEFHYEFEARKYIKSIIDASKYRILKIIYEED